MQIKYISSKGDQELHSSCLNSASSSNENNIDFVSFFFVYFLASGGSLYLTVYMYSVCSHGN